MKNSGDGWVKIKGKNFEMKKFRGGAESGVWNWDLQIARGNLEACGWGTWNAWGWGLGSAPHLDAKSLMIISPRHVYLTKFEADRSRYYLVPTRHV